MPANFDSGVLQIETAPVFVPLLQPCRYKVAWGGRGSGKSHFFAEMLVEIAVSRPGFRFVCIREVQKSLEQSVMRLVEDKIQAFGLGPYFRVMQSHIECPGDGLIIFQGMQNHTAESIKSLEGYDGAWVEEAQSLSERSLDMLRPTLRKEGSEIWFSYNPEDPDDPVDKFFRGPNKPGDGEAIIVNANWDTNPWFPEVLRKEKDYDRRRDPDKYAHIWLGKYRKSSEARVFKNWRVEEFETPDDARFFFGADWGFSVDPTVLVRCWGKDRTLYIDQEAYRVGCEIDYTPALFAGTDTNDPPRWSNPHKFEGIPGSLRWPITADSARPETISYMRRKGFNIKPALKGAGSVEDGIEFLKSYDIVVHPRCRHTIDELASYSWKVDPKTNEILPVLADKKNHVIDGLRYGLEGLIRKGVSMVDYL